jgi:hypothetical protein
MSAPYDCAPDMTDRCSSCEILARTGNPNYESHAMSHLACDLIVYVEAFGECVEVRYFYAAPDRSWPASGNNWCREPRDAVTFIASLVDGTYRGIENVGRVRITGVNSAADAVVHAAVTS